MKRNASPHAQTAIMKRHQDLTRHGVSCIPIIGRNRFLLWYPAMFHQHDHCIEIIYCANGVCTYRVADRELVLTPGDILAVPSNTLHSIREYPKGLRTYFLSFKTNDRRVLGLSQGESSWLCQQLRNLPLLFNASRFSLSAQFDRILQLAESEEDNLGLRISIRAAAIDLMLTILQAATRREQQPINRRLQNLIQKIQEHPEENYPITALVQEYGLSVNTLFTQFRKLAGETPHAYLLRCRIERAKQLLRDLPVATVSRQLGFPSPQHFATQFKHLTGHTPREFKGQDATRAQSAGRTIRNPTS